MAVAGVPRFWRAVGYHFARRFGAKEPSALAVVWGRQLLRLTYAAMALLVVLVVLFEEVLPVKIIHRFHRFRRLRKSVWNLCIHSW